MGTKGAQPSKTAALGSGGSAQEGVPQPLRQRDLRAHGGGRQRRSHVRAPPHRSFSENHRGNTQGGARVTSPPVARPAISSCGTTARCTATRAGSARPPPPPPSTPTPWILVHGLAITICVLSVRTLRIEHAGTKSAPCAGFLRARGRFRLLAGPCWRAPACPRPRPIDYACLAIARWNFPSTTEGAPRPRAQRPRVSRAGAAPDAAELMRVACYGPGPPGAVKRPWGFSQ
jgi:hypothetical protein